MRFCGISKLFVHLTFVGLLLAGCSSAARNRAHAEQGKLRALVHVMWQINRIIDERETGRRYTPPSTKLSDYWRLRVDYMDLATPERRAQMPDKVAALDTRIEKFERLIASYERYTEERSKVWPYVKTLRDGYLKQCTEAGNSLPAVRAGNFEIFVATAFYQIDYATPIGLYWDAEDKELAETDALRCLNRGEPLLLPGLRTDGSFEIHVAVRNTSSDRIERPNGYSLYEYETADGNGAVVTKVSRVYNVSFTDNGGNRYEFGRYPLGILSDSSKEGIRPGATSVWQFKFDRHNAPVTTVEEMRIIFDRQVFGQPVTLTIPMSMLERPELPKRRAFGSER